MVLLIGSLAGCPPRAVQAEGGPAPPAPVELCVGELQLSRGDVRATLSEVAGVSVTGGKARISDSAFTGPFRRAVRAEGAAPEVTVERTRFVEAVTAVQLVGARGHLRGLS